jgi:hypothetical protein
MSNFKEICEMVYGTHGEVPDMNLRKRQNQYKSTSKVQNVFYIEFRSGL